MRIFNKEISKNQVKVFIGGVILAAVGTGLIVKLTPSKETEVVDVDYEELPEQDQPIELESFRTEEA